MHNLHLKTAKQTKLSNLWIVRLMHTNTQHRRKDNTGTNHTPLHPQTNNIISESYLGRVRTIYPNTQHREKDEMNTQHSPFNACN